MVMDWKIFISAEQRISRVHCTYRPQTEDFKKAMRNYWNRIREAKTSTVYFLMQMEMETWIYLYAVEEMNFRPIQLISSAGYISMMVKDISVNHHSFYHSIKFLKVLLV